MQEPKMWLVFITALIPVVLGFVWYSKFAFGAMWQREAKVGNQSTSTLRMLLMLLLLYVVSVLFSSVIMFSAIHQMHLGSLMADPVNANLLKDINSQPYKDLSHFVNTYGMQFRSFKHGAFHGFLTSLFASSSILGTICMFERKSFKYFIIHCLFWCVCGLLIGGILCAYC